MKEISLAMTVIVATGAVLAVPAATAQVTCDIVVEVIVDSVRSGGVCRGEGGVCLDFYLICDGQPWPLPMDHRPESGHLARPPLRLALLDGNSQSADAHRQFRLDTAVAFTPSCKSRSLFERLDRRREALLPDEAAWEPRPIVSPAIAVPALSWHTGI